MEKIIYYSTFLLVRKEIRTWNQHFSFSVTPIMYSFGSQSVVPGPICVFLFCSYLFVFTVGYFKVFFGFVTILLLLFMF